LLVDGFSGRGGAVVCVIEIEADLGAGDGTLFFDGYFQPELAVNVESE
jgi:hypothetical protein